MSDDKDWGDETPCGCTCGGLGCASRRGLADARAGVTYHGSKAGYQNGCRCESCKAAKVASQQRRRRRANAQTLDGATRHYQEWTGPELELICSPDHSAREVAALIGRTMLAVKNMRRKCQTEPRYARLAGLPTAVADKATP